MDEKIFHAVAEVLCSVLRDVEDPTGLITIILLSYYQIKLSNILRDVEDPTGLIKIINIIGDFVIAIMIGELFDVLHGNVYTFDDAFDTHK